MFLRWSLSNNAIWAALSGRISVSSARDAAAATIALAKNAIGTIRLLIIHKFSPCYGPRRAVEDGYSAKGDLAPPAKKERGWCAGPRRPSPTFIPTSFKGIIAGRDPIRSHGLHDARADAVHRTTSVHPGDDPRDLRNVGPTICRGLA